MNSTPPPAAHYQQQAPGGAPLGGVRPKGYDHCCDCMSTQNRCSSDTCPCIRDRRICSERCESVRYRADCLNQAICKCSCELGGIGGTGGETPRSATHTPRTPRSGGKPLCSKPEKCECLRLRESCNNLCNCKQICRNKEVKRPAKITKSRQGCSCPKGGKSSQNCLRKDCSCRTSFEFCGPQCKCSSDCTNSQQKFLIPKHIQQCFLEQKNESSGLVLTLLGDDYIYRTEFFHDTKSEPHVEEQLIASMYELISKYRVDFYEALIYVSKSPCFHQDCDPKCEVIDECVTNKACSKLLGKFFTFFSRFGQ